MRTPPPSAFKDCLRVGYPHEVLYDTVWAMVENGLEPTIEVLTFLSPAADGTRLATSEVFSNDALGLQATWVLWALTDLAHDPVYGKHRDLAALGLDSTRLGRQLHPALLALIPPARHWIWRCRDTDAIIARLAHPTSTPRQVRRPGRHKPVSLRLWAEWRAAEDEIAAQIQVQP